MVVTSLSFTLLITAIAKNGSVLFRNPGDDAHMGAIFCRTHMDRHLFARLQDESVPAGTAEHSRRTAFRGPLHLSGLWIIDGQIQPGVRIRPLPFLDDAGDRDDLI